ncbi:hypothetical protein O6H91_16G020000 [Diphasiastrum complanatum]|uniref:Uncharacterized protein n=1 Tax=Diphasiastrum complanatum TaxID=34168 RepID=A0ACC2BA98_DIPCM|nr:hypothetical protein O6H91_16G020000 [Diphasiastrum complanatum]
MDLAKALVFLCLPCLLIVAVQSEAFAPLNVILSALEPLNNLIKDNRMIFMQSRALAKYQNILSLDSPVPIDNIITPSVTTIIVDQTGCGNFTTVQAAIDAIPDENTQPIVIQVNPGLYEEKLLVPINKPFITLQGKDSNITSIAWNDTANATGTYNSASVAIDAPNFVARNISFWNTAPGPAPGIIGAQAVALRISGDQAAFYGCRFFGVQDTLFDHQGRHYFKECYIQGSIDFIFGNGRSLYEDCQLHSIAKPSRRTAAGAITAQSREGPLENTGFSFVNCTVTGTGRIYLGRAWRAYSRVIFALTYMDDIIVPGGWSNWGDSNKSLTVFYGQYKCSGPGSVERRRVRWSHELTDVVAQPFLNVSFIDGDQWLGPSPIPSMLAKPKFLIDSLY